MKGPRRQSAYICVSASGGPVQVPSFFVIHGRDQGKRFELHGRQTFGIGRESTNSIRLNDSEVSRQHAKVERDDQQYRWIDLGSSNGTFINSVRIDQHELRSGDRIQIGRTLMIFTESTDAQTAVREQVDIVGEADQDRSRIIKSVSQEEGSELLSSPGPTNSPWLARARGNLQIMYRTALAVSHTLDIDQLLHRIMELIFEWVEADRGCIMLLDQETDEFVPKVRRDRQVSKKSKPMTISQTILDYVRSNQEGVLTSDAREDERWDAGASIVKLGVREAICVPMQGRYGMVGIIYIDTFTPPGRLIQEQPQQKFQDEHLKLMVAVGHQAALAVEDTSYYSAMVQAERLAAIGHTIAGLSHHVKNILQGIRGGSYLIEEGLKTNNQEFTLKGWRIVQKNQERISNLVMDMLSFSKERQPELVPSDLNSVVGDVIELLQSSAKDAGVTLIDERTKEIPEMTFDPEGIHRAVLNIVNNAIDACNECSPAQVTLRTEYDSEERRLRVLIKDTGAGISPKDTKRIFNVFASEKGNRGTGLGLPVSQKILREHNGEIRVESQLGVGSTFVIEFPAVLADSTSASAYAPGTSEADREE